MGADSSREARRWKRTVFFRSEEERNSFNADLAMLSDALGMAPSRIIAFAVSVLARRVEESGASGETVLSDLLAPPRGDRGR